MTEIVVTAIVSIFASPVVWKGFNTLINTLSKKKTLSNNEFKDYLFKKVEEQSKHIEEQSHEIAKLNNVITELRVEVEKLRKELEFHEKQNAPKVGRPKKPEDN
jgi:uncharacterized coiled-coil protein SlyX